jgi:hypothetical protein
MILIWADKGFCGLLQCYRNNATKLDLLTKTFEFRRSIVRKPLRETLHGDRLPSFLHAVKESDLGEERFDGKA